MSTDNRTNEPTPEQVEAAAKELAVYEWVSWEVVPDHIKVMYRAQARAALVAAQGAAPQAEHEYEHLLKARALHQTNAGLPSSGVDEDKLAEVLREAEQSWHLSDEKSQQSYACGAPDLKSKYTARAVAEWLKGQGGERR